MKKEEYTKQQILKAMLELLIEKEIDQITITELVKRAGVGRASFYRNYSTKEDVLADHLKKLILRWGEEFEKEGNPDVNASLVKHFWNEKSFYLTLYNANLGPYIYKAMKAAMNIEEKVNPVERYLVSWYAGSIYGFIDEWMKNGMKESPEEMFALMKEIFKH